MSITRTNGKRIQLDLISVHFGARDWTDKLIQNIIRFDPLASTGVELARILIGDNERNAKNVDHFQRLDPRIEVVTCSPDQDQYRRYGHDHAATLTRLLGRTTGEIVVILDNDAHPISERWTSRIVALLREFDAITASDPREPSLSHPCFMAFTRRCLEPIPILDTGKIDGYDVGRAVRMELEARELRVYVPKWRRAFGGVWGTIYDEIIYHHGSASFSYSQRHQAMVNPYSDFFAARVLKRDRYHRTLADRVRLALRSRLRRVRAMLLNRGL